MVDMQEWVASALLGLMEGLIPPRMMPVPGREDVVYTMRQGGTPLLVDLRLLADRPERKSGSFTLRTPHSFGGYVAAHAGPGTAVFVDPISGRAEAILDGHGPEPGWGSHRVTLALQPEPAWSRIVGICQSGAVEQEMLANWLDDNRESVVDPDATTLIELIDTLHVFAESSQREIRNTAHGRSLVFVDGVGVKGGAGHVDLPNKFAANCPVWRGVPVAFRFEVRLTVVAAPGKKTQFRLSVPRFDDVLARATEAAIDLAREVLPREVPIYDGAAPSSFGVPPVGFEAP